MSTNTTNIVLLGQVDHGKSTLAHAIAKKVGNKQTFDEISGGDEDSVLGVTISRAQIEWEKDNRDYALIDPVGHMDIIKQLLVGESIPDALILVIYAIDGIQPQAREQLQVAATLGYPPPIVWLNRVNVLDDDEILEVLELEIQNLFDEVGLSGDDATIMNGSEKTAITDLLAALSNVASHDPDEQSFRMAVEAIYPVKDDENASDVTGQVARGMLEVPRQSPQEVEIVGFEETRKVMVSEILMFDKVLESAQAGDNVGLRLRPIEENELRRGQVIATPGTLNAASKFTALIYLRNNAEGGPATNLLNNNQGKIMLWGTDVDGTFSLSEGHDRVMPGEYTAITIELINQIALEQGTRFAIREGGRAIGVGAVTKLE